MTLKNVVMFLTLFLVAIPSFGNAQGQLPKIYTQDEVDAKLNELRSQYNPQSVSREIDIKLDALQAELKQLIDGNHKLNEQATANIIQRIGRDEQSDQQKAQRSLSSISASLIGAFITLLGVIITVLVLLFVHYQTLDLKQIESTLEFSKRFGELIQRQTELNKSYVEARANGAGSAPSPVERDQAESWWWQFFDLMVYEYDFFREGLLWDQRFARWMLFRWYEYNAEKDKLWKTCGISYQEGWNSWLSKQGNQGNRLSRFLKGVHEAQTSDKVWEMVMAESPKPGRLFRWMRHSYDLD